MRKHKGFTLVELLVVIAIIAVLLAVLMPALSSIKSAAKRIQCANRMGGIGKSLTMYVEASNGSLPTLEYYRRTDGKAFRAGIESTYLVNKRAIVGPGEVDPVPAYLWRHLGCLFGAGLIDSGQSFYCPAVDGWREEYVSMCQSGSDGSTAVIWGNPRHNWSQGAKAGKGYVYWPLGKEMATGGVGSGTIGYIPSSTAQTRYKAGLPLNATKINELLMTRPIAADNQFHSTKSSGWTLNTVYPDGHVLLQMQPKLSGLGMYSANENCQFPKDIWDGAFLDDKEKALNMTDGVTPTEFAYALQP
jgi:prepilin-type N-terminal cleavage/methylation domain-containing protein